MASDDLDIPQIAIVGAPEGNNHATPTQILPSPSSGSAGRPRLLPPSQASPTDSQGFLSSPTPILKSGRNSLHAVGSPSSHTSDTSVLQPPPSPLSAHSTGSDATGTLPSPTHTHVDVVSDVPSRSSSPASFFRKTLHRVRRLSPPPSGETDTGSDTTRNDGQKGDSSDTRRKGPEFARLAVLDLKQEADFGVHPSGFKPLQLASLFDPKDLETLESMGGVDAILRGLGRQPAYGVSTKLGLSPSNAVLPDPTSQDFSESHATDKNPPKPNIMVTSPASVPQGLQSTASLAGGSGGLHTTFQSSEAVYTTSIKDRKRFFGQNIVPQRPSKTLLQLMWLALKDKVLILLSIAAVVSLSLGHFQDFGQPHLEGEAPLDWVEGVTILVAIVIVVLVGSLNDWQKEMQFKVLNEKREERVIKVIRDGEEQMIDIHSVVVGDVVLFEPGKIIPYDGIFLYGHNVRCDESGATGESYRECITPRETRFAEFDPDSAPCDGESVSGSRRNAKLSGLDSLGHTDYFVVSGSKVIQGIGSYLVIVVGTKSFNGRIMMALRTAPENTPLQLKLNDLAEVIAKIESIAGVLLFVTLFIRFIVQVATNNPPRNPNEKGIGPVQILVVVVTVVVVAVPEGLPLAITLALAFATKQMTEENLLVRVLGSSETMANALAICTDKFQNKMTVFAGSVGAHTSARFARKLDENTKRASSKKRSYPNSRDFAIDLSNLNAIRTPQLVEPFNASVSVNWTAFEDVDPDSVASVFVVSKTETALSKFARNLGWANYKDTRNGTNLIPFSSDLKAILFSKSASKVITPRCMRNVVVFYGPQLGQGHRHISRNRQRMSHDHRPASRQASQEGNLLTPPNVVSTRGRTASEATPREVDRGISGQPTAPSRGQQQPSTVEICPRDPSNGMSSTQLQPYAVGSPPNVFCDDNTIVGNSPPYRESLPAADDSTGALCVNGNGNGGSDLDSSLRSHTANRAEGSTGVRTRAVVAVACSVSFFFFYYFYLHF